MPNLTCKVTLQGNFLSVNLFGSAVRLSPTLNYIFLPKYTKLYIVYDIGEMNRL